MRIVIAAILWGIGGTIFGAFNALIIARALDWPALQTAFIIGALGAVGGLIYGVLATPRHKLALTQENDDDGKPRYNLEPCAWCRGTGAEGKSKKQCSVCHGRQQVLVKQPSQICPKCKGKGKLFMRRKCTVCSGGGWNAYAFLDNVESS